MDLPSINTAIPHISPTAPNEPPLLEGCSAIIFVVDITDDYVAAFTKLCALALHAQSVDSSIAIEVLLHKADLLEAQERKGIAAPSSGTAGPGLPTNRLACRTDVLKDIAEKINEELIELCQRPPPIFFHLSSIYDHTIFVCLSRIIQKNLPESMALEVILDTMCTVCKVEKAFLFNVPCGLYLAADSSPCGIETFALASESVDMICDMHTLYQTKRAPSSQRGGGGGGASDPAANEHDEDEEVHPAHRQRQHTSPPPTTARTARLSRGELHLSNDWRVRYTQMSPSIALITLDRSHHHVTDSTQSARLVDDGYGAAAEQVRTSIEALLGPDLV